MNLIAYKYELFLFILFSALIVGSFALLGILWFIAVCTKGQCDEKQTERYLEERFSRFWRSFRREKYDRVKELELEAGVPSEPQPSSTDREPQPSSTHTEPQPSSNVITDNLEPSCPPLEDVSYDAVDAFAAVEDTALVSVYSRSRETVIEIEQNVQAPEEHGVDTDSDKDESQSDLSYSSTQAPTEPQASTSLLNESESCKLCGEELEDDGSPVVKVTQKGADTINKYSEMRNFAGVDIKAGDKVHVQCRKDHTDPKNKRMYGTIEEPEADRIRKRSRSGASEGHGFCYKTDCLFCKTRLIRFITDDKGNTIHEFISKYPEHRAGAVSFVESKQAFDLNIRSLLADRTDAKGVELKGRIQMSSCLRADDCLYHRACYQKFIYDTGANRQTIPGRPVKESYGLAFERTMHFFESAEEKLITVKDLQDVMSEYCDEPYSIKHMKRKLLERYGDRIEIAAMCGKTDVVIERESLASVLHQLHDNQNNDSAGEVRHVLQSAAKILANAAKSYSYDPSHYFSIDEINTATQLDALPKEHKIFLNALRSKRSRSDDTLAIIALAQSMMHLSAKHYIPPLHVALATEIHTKTGSQLLVDLFHQFKMTASIKCVRNFERNAAVQDCLQLPEDCSEIDDGSLWSADNVDVLKRGGTFHGMGIVLAHRLKQLLSQKIQRREVSAAEILRKATKIKELPPAFNPKKAKDLALSLRNVVDVQTYLYLLQPSGIDYLRICASVTKDVPQIAGCMHIMTKANRKPEPQEIEFLPIIGISSTHWKCVYTTVTFVIEQHEKLRLPGKPVLTFDQPLWYKSMVLCKHLKLPVVNLLGNFHTQMSFLGAIGYVMANSGIEQAFGSMYGQDSIKWIMNGKSYERAMRCHGLATSALKKIILEKVQPEHDYAVEAGIDYFDSLMENPDETPLTISNDNLVIAELMEVVNNIKDSLPDSDLTRLWLTYIDMYDILLMNLHAERLGDWDKYISSLRLMLPYMAASGHRPYTKSLWTFIQDMEDLNDFTLRRFKEGGFVVHRTAVAYSGVSPDLNIEQTLMASIKGNQGLTRGRGWTELNQLIWLGSRPTVCKLDHQLREMAGIETRTGQGSVKATRSSRLARDTKDLDKLEKYFNERLLFAGNVASNLRNITTGLVAPLNVSVHKAYDVGNRLLQSMIGHNPLTVEIPKASLAVQMPKSSVASKATSKINEIDPNLLLQRALLLAASPDVDTSLEECLRHELATVPPSIIDEWGFMRSNSKADLATHIIGYLESETVINSPIPRLTTIVMDGGALLHRIVWGPVGSSSIQSLLELYNAHIWKQFGRLVHVIFDGYSERSTKDHCHRKRAPILGLRMLFTNDTIIQTKKAVFLSNPDNKEQFVRTLGQYLEEQGHKVTYCREDADWHIVDAGYHELEESDTVVVGDDTDLLIMMLHRFRSSNSDNELYMFRPSSDTLLNIRDLVEEMPVKINKSLLLIHAASGCDTVSSISGIGKTRLIKQMEKPGYPLNDRELRVFYQPNLAPDNADLLKSGIRLLILMYDMKAKNSETMETIRLRIYRRKLKGKKAVELHSLPMTTSPAHQHILRIYLQVQQWLGNELDPTNYGWIIGEDGSYSPDMGVKDICPKAILKIIHCNCTKGCSTNACGCRKLNILCTISCNCEDNNTCNNNKVVQSLDQDSDDEDSHIDDHELYADSAPSETESESDWEFPS